MIEICEKIALNTFVSKQENWEMEKINAYKADDFISEIFWGSTSDVLKKILVLNIFSNSQDDNNNEPPESNLSSFEKIYSQTTSLIKRRCD